MRRQRIYSHYRGIIFKRLFGVCYIYINKWFISETPRDNPVSTLYDCEYICRRIAILPFLLSSSLLGISSPHFSLFLLHLSSASPLGFRLTLATHSADIERTSRGAATPGREFPGWLVGSLLQSRSLTYLSPLLGREIEPVFFARLRCSPIRLHLIADSFTRSNSKCERSRINRLGES